MNMLSPATLLAERATERASSLLIGALDAPASFKAAAFAALNITQGHLVMVTPDGRRLSFGDASAPETVLEIKSFRFARRLLSGGDIGLAESFMLGEWDTPHLSEVLTLLSANADRIMRVFRGNPLTRLLNLVSSLSRENTRRGSRKNILAHYDLGNAFYESWLDDSMTYSSARFDLAPGASLAEAQRAKYRALAKTMHLRPGETVLEIGCGWGGFAEVAATEFGAIVTGLTISDEQFAFASERLRRAGLQDRVSILKTDYRDIEGAFDKVASIEMFEAVGEKYWPGYFAKVHDVLKPDGRAGLQVITIRDELFESYRSRVDFIQKYVFPGGMLPSIERLEAETARAGLHMEDAQAFGQSYAETLAAWNKRFIGAWDRIRPLGFDEQFKRLWRFYLSYCEAGFRTKRTDVVQFALKR
jgi:cyclopropane-fatty-acyl-phospholipid synthase